MYLSVSGEVVTVKIIEKSRFITTSRHVEGEEQAKAFIEETSAKYSDATHNCYAYICDKYGNFLRFSDNGEPQGTAGMPMLEVIKNKKLFETAVVVTRYFGGIKLGAGGLVRAYSGCVAENLDKGSEHMATLFKRMDHCHEYAFLGFLLEYGARVVKMRPLPRKKIEFYGDSVTAGEVSEAISCCGKEDPEHEGEYSNAYFSYAWATARRLHARVHIVAQGGIALLDGTGYFMGREDRHGKLLQESTVL